MNGVVDADTHVIEHVGIWEFMPENMYHRRPIPVTVPPNTLYRHSNAFWLIDGRIMPKPAGQGSFPLHTPSAAIREVERKDISLGCRELTDPGARLRDMDNRGIEVQVIYPTLFIMYITDDVDLEVAMYRAYNRWMAEACSNSNGRLRWIMVPPLRSIDATIEEMHFAKQHGAVGVLFRGVEKTRSLAHPYFFPVYQEAQQLHLPICVHTGGGAPGITDVFDVAYSSPPQLPPLAFRDIVTHRTPEKFPDLRFGFIETGAMWIPDAMHKMGRRSRRSFRPVVDDRGARFDPGIFRDYKLYVTCFADEDLPYLLKYINEEHLLVGSDYGHQDPSEEAQLVSNMRSREDLPPSVIEKILCGNPRQFYPLD